MSGAARSSKTPARGDVDVFRANTFVREGELIVQDGLTYYKSADGTTGSVFDSDDWTLLPTGLGAVLTALSSKADLVSGKVPDAQLPAGSGGAAVLVPFSVDGDLEVGQGTKRLYLPTAGAIQSIEVALGTSPDETSVIVDVNKNGSTLFTTQANRPTVAPGSHHSGLKVPGITAISVGDYLTFDVDQIGTQPSGSTSTPTFVSDTAQAQEVGVSTYDVTLPAGIQEGDWWGMTLRVTGSVAPVDTESGFTAKGSNVGTGGSSTVRAYYYWRLHDGDTGPWTFTFGGAVTVFARNILYRGVDQTTPVDTYVNSMDQGSGTTAIDAPAPLTTTVPNCVIVYQLALTANRRASTPGFYTPRNAFNGIAGTNTNRHLADISQASAGLASAPTFDLDAAAAKLMSRTALRPLVVDPPDSFETGADLVGIIRYLES